MARLLAVGDIHGCADTVKALMEKVKPKVNDKLVFLGDYIDRGPSSYETIDYLINLSLNFDTTFLKGNHEDAMIKYLYKTISHGEDDAFFRNGGQKTIDSYLKNIGENIILSGKNGTLHFNNLDKSHQDFYNNLKLYEEIDNFLFVHAGVRPGVPLEEQYFEDLIWIRHEFLFHPGEIIPGKIIVHGHTPMFKEKRENYNLINNDRINLDEGCVMKTELNKKYLICMDVRTREEYRQLKID